MQTTLAGFEPTSRDSFGLASRGLSHSAKVCSGIAGQSSPRMCRSSCNTLSFGAGSAGSSMSVGPMCKTSRYASERGGLEIRCCASPSMLATTTPNYSAEGPRIPKERLLSIPRCMMQFPHLAFCDHTLEIPEQSRVSDCKCALSQFPNRILRCMQTEKNLRPPGISSSISAWQLY